MNLIMAAFRAFEMGLKLLLQVLDDVGYRVGVLQPLKELAALTGAERLDGGRQVIEIVLFHHGPPAIAGVSYSLVRDQHLDRTWKQL